MGDNRVSLHRGKKGVAKHNEHEFYKGEKDTEVIRVECGKNGTLTESEIDFYTENYGEELAIRNEKYRKKGNYAKVKTIEEVYNSPRYKPTEEIVQYGHAGGVVPDKETFGRMMTDYINWKIEWSKVHGGHLHVLNYACHYDETTPHAHVREVWDYEDNGVKKIAQEKGMECAGLELPDPTKKPSQHNNRGMVWTALCRTKWQDICEQYGYDVERVPLPRRGSKSIEEYKAEQDREAVEQAQDKAQEIYSDLTQYSKPQTGLFGRAKDTVTVPRETYETLTAMCENVTQAHNNALAVADDREHARAVRQQADKLLKQAKSERDKATALRQQAEKEIQTRAEQQAQVIIAQKQVEADEQARKEIAKLKADIADRDYYLEEQGLYMNFCRSQDEMRVARRMGDSDSGNMSSGKRNNYTFANDDSSFGHR